MNFTIKKVLFACTVSFFLTGCVINNPQPEECITQAIIVTEVYEGTTNDIVLKDDGTDFYYINRGVEQGINVKDLKFKILNKKVTLHLPKIWVITSEHIAQLALNDEVIYTEFN